MWAIRKSSKIRLGIGFDFGNGEPLQVRWNRKIKNSLYGFIPKLIDFSQSNLGFR
jgi:hypothetical protein